MTPEDIRRIYQEGIAYSKGRHNDATFYPSPYQSATPENTIWMLGFDYGCAMAVKRDLKAQIRREQQAVEALRQLKLALDLMDSPAERSAETSATKVK